LAFSTIQGSGGAPDSFVGTSGVDAITIIDSLGNFFLGAQQANDVATFVSANQNDGGVISNATLKGGQGSDSFTVNAGSGMTVLNAVFVNGNSEADTLTFNSGLLSATTVQGGQGGDTITLGGNGATSSVINGNKNADTININGGSSSSSFFGGQGTDTINVAASATSSVIDGDNDNDLFVITAAQNLTGSSILGGQGNDSINTTAGAGVIGAQLAFLADGGDGNDQVVGSAQNDTLIGGAGNDTITGNAGADRLTGEGGSDQFAQAPGSSSAAAATSTAGVANANVFANGETAIGAFDVITDYSSAADSLINTGIVGAIINNNFAAGAANNFLIRGNYVAAAAGDGTGTFTAALNGTDVLFFQSNGLIGNFAQAGGTSTTVLLGAGASIATIGATVIS